MKSPGRFTVVFAGYTVAILAAWVAIAWRAQHERVAGAHASAGMYAFGDAIFGLAVFTLVAIVPTVLALRFLRRHGWFWKTAVALTIVAATMAMALAIFVLSRVHR
jgi:hypothetical protein